MIKRVSPHRSVRSLSWAPLCLVGAGLLLTLSGCPGGADLEHPEKYGDVFSTGSGATGGTGPQALPVVEGCDFPAFIPKTCGKRGCHATPTDALPAAAALNLNLDDGFVSRLKDVPSTHMDIYCGNVACEVPPDACPKGDLLINSQDYANSWLLKKVGPDTGCGDVMPIGVLFADADLACFEKLVKAIAELP